jgi:hypothetical protein
MGFVRTAEEIARIQSVLRQPRFVGAEMLPAGDHRSPSAGLRASERASCDGDGRSVALELRR